MSNYIAAAGPLAIVLVLLVAILAASAIRGRQRGAMCCPVKLRLRYAAVAVVVAGAVGLQRVSSEPSALLDAWWWHGGAWVALVLSLVLFAKVSLEQVRLTEEGIERRRWPGAAQRLTWSQVRQVSVDSLGKSFFLQGPPGQSVRVLRTLGEQQRFAEQVLARVPRAQIQCLYTLKQVAAAGVTASLTNPVQFSS